LWKGGNVGEKNEKKKYIHGQGEGGGQMASTVKGGWVKVSKLEIVSFEGRRESSIGKTEKKEEDQAMPGRPSNFFLIILP